MITLGDRGVAARSSFVFQAFKELTVSKPLLPPCMALRPVAFGSSGAVLASVINWLAAPPPTQPAAFSLCSCALSAFSFAELLDEVLARVPRGAATIAVASFVAGFCCCVILVVLACGAFVLFSREQASRYRCLRRGGLLRN